MIITEILTELKQFKSLKAGDIIACEFHRNMYEGRGDGFKFGVFKIALIKEHTNEIILNRKWNNYFNYKLFLDKDGGSNLKSAVLIKQIEEEI